MLYVRSYLFLLPSRAPHACTLGHISSYLPVEPSFSFFLPLPRSHLLIIIDLFFIITESFLLRMSVKWKAQRCFDTFSVKPFIFIHIMQLNDSFIFMNEWDFFVQITIVYLLTTWRLFELFPLRVIINRVETKIQQYFVWL